MRVRPRDVSSACALFVLLCSTRVHAADLRWRAPAECERKDNVAAQVERLIGRPLADVTAVDFEVEVRRAPDASWLVAVQAVVPQDALTPRARELHGATCDEVSDAAALAIAMAVQERAADNTALPADTAPASTPAAAQGAALNPQSPAAAGPPTPLPDAIPDADSNALRFGIGLGVLFDAGALPSLAPGGQVEFSGAYAALRVSLFGSAFVPQREDLPGEDRGGEFQLVLGGIRLCAAPRFGQVQVMGCTGFELGQISGEGAGNVRQSRTQHAGWRAVLSEVGASWEFVPQFAGLLRVGTAWPLSRPEFVLDGTTGVHRPDGLSFRLLIGLEMYL